jgi:hypothetical protein
MVAERSTEVAATPTVTILTFFNALIGCCAATGSFTTTGYTWQRCPESAPYRLLPNPMTFTRVLQDDAVRVPALTILVRFAAERFKAFKILTGNWSECRVCSACRATALQRHSCQHPPWPLWGFPNGQRPSDLFHRTSACCSWTTTKQSRLWLHGFYIRLSMPRAGQFQHFLEAVGEKAQLWMTLVTLQVCCADLLLLSRCNWRVECTVLSADGRHSNELGF